MMNKQRVPARRRRARAVATGGTVLGMVLGVALGSPAHAIRGGAEAVIDAYPWVVEVQAFADGEWFTNCTASLIDPHVVATAAHCIPGAGGIPADVPLRLVFGRDDAQDDPSLVLNDVDISQVITNPEFGHEANRDIALIVLDDPATVAPPVPLARLDDELAPGDDLTAVGWGRLDDGTPTEHLMSVDIPVHSSGSDEMIEAGGPDAGANPGDSGGPGLAPAPHGALAQYGIVSGMTNDEFMRTGYTNLATPGPWEAISDDMREAGIGHLVPTDRRPAPAGSIDRPAPPVAVPMRRSSLTA